MKATKKAIANVHLRQAREARGWSQQQVAEQVGTTAFTVCRWEKGNTFPQPHFRQLLRELFEKDVAELGLVPDHEFPAAIVLPDEKKGTHSYFPRLME